MWSTEKAVTYVRSKIEAEEAIASKLQNQTLFVTIAIVSNNKYN